MEIKELFRKLFLVKEIRSKAGFLHFQRWRILATKYFSIYIHKIYAPDEDKYLHNHPWNYFNLILFGGYEEISCKYTSLEYKNMLPFRFSFRRHDTYHKINRLFRTTTTLFLTGQRKYDWGYNIDGEMVPNDQYRKNKHDGLYDNEEDKKWKEIENHFNEINKENKPLNL